MQFAFHHGEKWTIQAIGSFLETRGPGLGKFCSGFSPILTQVPSRKRLASSLLDDVYAQEQARLASSIKRSRVTLGCDAWTNPMNIPILGFTLNHHLVHITETSGQPHTCEFLTREVSNVIQKLQTDFEVDIIACVSDSASNMTGMRQGLRGSLGVCFWLFC